MTLEVSFENLLVFLGAGKHGGVRAGPSFPALPAVSMFHVSESCCLGPYMESCNEKDYFYSLPRLYFMLNLL